MKNELLYIHRLDSNKDSRKFKLIKQAFSQTHYCHCVEWSRDTLIKEILFSYFKKYMHCRELVIVGDSTGANFAYQLREMFRCIGVKVQLVLLCPILNIAHCIRKMTFTANVKNSLVALNKINDCFLLQSLYDTIVDPNRISIGSRVMRLKIDDKHDLDDFADYLCFILKYIEQTKVYFLQ